MRIRTGLAIILALAALPAIHMSASPPEQHDSTASAAVTPAAVSVGSVENLKLVTTVAPALAVARVAIAHLDSSSALSVLERFRVVGRPRAVPYAEITTPNLSNRSASLRYGHRNRGEIYERTRLLAYGVSTHRLTS